MTKRHEIFSHSLHIFIPRLKKSISNCADRIFRPRREQKFSCLSPNFKNTPGIGEERVNMTLCVNCYVVQSRTGENTDTVMTNNLSTSTNDITYKEKISVLAVAEEQEIWK